LRDATDIAIFHAARAAGAKLLSKDSDFVDLVQRLGPPPQLLWLTCGNGSNRHLQIVLQSAFPKALALIEAGEPIVEIGDL
jgi:predicted nuclease of predicted toxin-antitoxin system